MIKINLLAEGKRPVAVRKKKQIGVKVNRQNAAGILLLLGLALGLAATGVWWWMLRSELEAQKLVVQDRQRQYDELKPIIAEVDEFKKKTALLNQKIEVINTLKNNQSGPVKIMDYVSRALPEMIWLDRMEVTGNTVKINGRATNENAVASFIDNLNKLDEAEEFADFKEPVLRQMRATSASLFSFEITITYTLTKPRATDEGASA